MLRFGETKKQEKNFMVQKKKKKKKKKMECWCWTKIEDLKNIALDALPVYNDRYIKIKVRTYDDKVYTNFHGLNVPEDRAECKSFTVISIDSLLVYERNTTCKYI